ncbi:hypothetical protein HMPREF0345_0711 [Enterococcus faecalis ATCC 29200]|nr:hypothetical protein HMPREF0345_0711 [Enterococcus faecalis ATCC 29200]OSH39620.1 hypothetical protein YM116_2564 [Enterococcus faecalis]
MGYRNGENHYRLIQPVEKNMLMEKVQKIYQMNSSLKMKITI